VSRSSSDTLRVFVAPDRVAAVRTRRSLLGRARVAPGGTLRVEATEANNAAPVAAFGALLDAEEGAPRRASLVLSNALVRYLVVPWSARITAADERLALARHAFGSVFGAGAATWTFVVSPAGNDAQTLAAAVDTGLLDGLRDAAAMRGVQLDSVQPLLMAVFNRWRREVGREALHLLVLEPGRWCWASIATGVWRRVQAGRVDEREPGAVSALIARELSLGAAGDAAAVMAPQVWLYSEGTRTPEPLPEAGEWRLRQLALAAEDRGATGDAGAEHALLAA
jgi:hypothetical protein